MNDYRIRGLYLVTGFVVVILIFMIRLFYLQVLSGEYAVASYETDVRDIPLYPARGIIFDRNERIYVKNSPIYDIKFIPKNITIPDTSILEEYLGIDRAWLRKEIKKYSGIDRYRRQSLASQVDKYTYNRLSEHLWQLGGISVEVRPTREYEYECGSHFLGFINQVDSRDTARTNHPDSLFKYQPRDLIGRTGLESQYEHLLRGMKGKKTILVDAYNREVDSYAGGKYDVDPIPGTDLLLGVDVELQMFAEMLMKGKKGSLVAIEPSSGEILAFVSAPGINPSILTGSSQGKNYLELQKDTLLKPLVNRALSAQYPPGSIFKILQAMAAMSAGVADINTHHPCPGFWPRGPSGKPGCHGSHGYCSLENGIKYSCNPFFAELYYSFMSHPKYENINEAFGEWRQRMDGYGIGHKLGVDIPDEKPGNLPTAAYYDKVYNKSWSGVTIFSNAIGRGEVLMTPLQMANEVALVANRGWYITPHFLRARKTDTGVWQRVAFDTVKVNQPAAHFEIAADAMEQVVLSGTATRAQIDSIAVCGKTGTVAFKEKDDHSVFVCFAPKHNPKIAVSVIIEHVGYGGTWAAPIASLTVEQYLRGYIKNERKLKRILEADFITPEIEAAKQAQAKLEAARALQQNQSP